MSAEAPEPMKETCSQCGGSGLLENIGDDPSYSGADECPDCSGEGMVEAPKPGETGAKS